MLAVRQAQQVRPHFEGSTGQYTNNFRYVSSPCREGISIESATP